jgi:hypothetical protein
MHNPWLLVLTGEVSRSSFLDPTVRKCPFVLSEPPDSRWHLDLDLKVGFTELVFMQHDRDLHALGASSKDKWWLTKRYTVYGCIRYIYTPNSCFFYHQVPIFSEYFPHTQMPNGNFEIICAFSHGSMRWTSGEARLPVPWIKPWNLGNMWENASWNIVNMWGSSFQISEKVEVFNH